MIQNFLNQKMQDSINILKESSNSPKEINTIILDSKFFNEMYFKSDIRNLELKPLFDGLLNIKKPVLYWFEIDNFQTNAEIIRDLYLNHLKNKSGRNISSYKKNFDSNSKTLYVGKVKTGFWGRVITHLGYHKSEKTAGLQLFQWYNVAKGQPSLKLHYIVFENNMQNQIAVLEYELAQELKPILGRY
jgi:hypothetical protein